MFSTVINYIITFALSSALTCLVGILVFYGNIKKSLKCLLRSNITSQYYVYSKIGHTPSYEKENMNYMYQQYKQMGGNSYVDALMGEFNKLPVKED